jgi:hypothetical protein
MDTVITTMALLVGGLLVIAVTVAGWEAMQRSITEQLAREAYAANAAALERPFLQSQPGAETAMPEVPAQAGAAPQPDGLPAGAGGTSLVTPRSPDVERRRAVVAQALQHAARPDPPATTATPAASPTSWLDTVPAATLTLPPGGFDLEALAAARDAGSTPTAPGEPSVVAERRQSVDLLLQ